MEPAQIQGEGSIKEEVWFSVHISVWGGHSWRLATTGDKWQNPGLNMGQSECRAFTLNYCYCFEIIVFICIYFVIVSLPHFLPHHCNKSFPEFRDFVCLA